MESFKALQMETPAKDMVKKLEFFLARAIEQDATICAAILDPRFNIKYFHSEIFLSVTRKFRVTPGSIKAVFERAAEE